MLRIPKGTKDVLSPESSRWQDFFVYLQEFFSRFSYEYLITPTIEYTELFTGSVGQQTDIVTKEMYTFTDKGGEQITLRPEGTSAVMRAYLMQDERANSLKKLWYFGPMFRYERPQKGRYREFYQFGVEIIGQSSPYLDAELIYMLYQLYQSLGITVKVLINSLGCKTCIPNYKDVLRQYYKDKKDKVCDDCKTRIDKNILRVLDCKNKQCEPIKQAAPRVSEHLCESCNTHFKILKDILSKLAVPFYEDYKLVRGLDYYNRTVFEFVSEEFGVDKALGGGGRYDYLSRKFINKDVPAVGFAGGVERTLQMAKSIPLKKRPSLYIAILDDAVLNEIAVLFQLKYALNDVLIEDDGYKVRSLKKHITRALNSNMDFMLIIGSTEIETKTFVLKDLNKRTEHKLAFNDIEKLKQLLNATV